VSGATPDDRGFWAPPLLVVMGVSGAGKSTIGQLLAARLGLPFRDADDFHPPANIAKMSAGLPLDDTDRAPWLAAIGAWLRGRQGAGAIATCSALKRGYRDALRAAAPGIRFVFLHGEVALVTARQSARQGHFMPASLVASQFATLEAPEADEPDVISAHVGAPPEAVVERVLSRLGRG
jgi:gluconokinase